ncbi:MAG: helicase-related protein [Patescibacteria group bacterium]
MTAQNKIPSEILVASVTPYFLERADFWFVQNQEKIKRAASQQLWWQENTLWLSQESTFNLFALLRRLTEMGYRRVQTLGAPGEFAQRGGWLEIFPINSAQAWRLEFRGRQIFSMEVFPVKIIRAQKSIQKDLTARASQALAQVVRLNDYLTHLDHGIGRFLGFAQSAGGLITQTSPTVQSPEKFFVLEYAKADRLYVPLVLEEKLTQYVGFEEPLIHRLGGTLWLKTKRRAKADSLALAKELLLLYGQRTVSRGFAYPATSSWEKELAADFPYVETDDQARAITDVMRDMESAKPMDRLICGDVGFGKTEVALRAAFKGAEGGKQIAVLAPTTILANQHWHTFCHRLKKFPVRLALLTRLQSKKEQQKILEELKEGKIDIIIGTHRLLSKDVQFSAQGGSASGGKNLGLAIIDEEQRFGVKQKEKFKVWRSQTLPRGERSEFYEAMSRDDSPTGESFYGIDILSLSATPIPRTLHLTLAGLRDVSIINTPPPGRLPIKTFVQPFNKKIIKEAITKELARNGQVYYLHNRVETIGLALRQLKKLLPRVNFGFIHGRLPEKQLIKIMADFEDKKIDVLVATTIIENGLDFQNVNTLIVANAARLGLAQAYQIRGRIGRSDRQAFAYFLYNAKYLTDNSKERLLALQENEALGSGYRLALRDLEIRGAGNVLGREQSGPVNSVGLNLYMQMLNESIEEMKSASNPFARTDELG